MDTYFYEFNAPNPPAGGTHAGNDNQTQHSNDALVLTDGDSKVVAVSRAFLAFVHRREDEVVGRPLSQLLPEQLREPVRELYQQVFSGAQLLTGDWGAGATNLALPVFDARLLSRDGTEHVIEVRTVLVRENDQTLLLSSLRDVTDRKQAENTLREKAAHEAHLRAAFESAGEAMLVTNRAGTIVDANPAAARLLDQPRQQLVGRAVANLIEAAGGGRLLGSSGGMEREDRPVIMEMALSDGQTRVVEYTPTSSEQSEFGITVIRDITGKVTEAERLKAQTQRQEQLVQELKRAQEAERRRLAMDIHDGPLQSIGVSLLALDRGMRKLGRGETEATLAELENLRAGLLDTVVDLRAVLADLSQELLATHGLKVALQSHVTRFADLTGIQVELNMQLEERLPGDMELLIYRLTQEALSNVRKHSRAGYASVTLSGHDSNVVLVISDNGTGFDLRNVHQERAEGKNIGLASMRQRVDSIQGTLEVATEPGKGTTLIFTFPHLPRVSASLSTTPLPNIPH